MGIVFNAEEILEIAEQIERNGQSFYKQAAENATDESHKKLLLELHNMEINHERTFSDMKSALTPQEREAKDIDPSHEAAAYLKQVADGNVFDYKKDPGKLLTGTESMDKVLQTALAMEKESVVFYIGIKAMVPERLGTTRVDDIIKEELSHITLLSKELVNLKG